MNQSAQGDEEEGGKAIEDPRLLAGYQLAHRLYSPIKFRKEISAIWEAIGCPARTGTVSEKIFYFTVPVPVSWVTVEYFVEQPIKKQHNKFNTSTVLHC